MEPGHFSDTSEFEMRDAVNSGQGGEPMRPDAAVSEHGPVEERDRFTLYLRTAAEIAGRINRILDTRQLLVHVVNLLKERFGFYHVHIYTLDEATHDLVMKAGSGEPGRLMKERGHKIPLDREKSLVARAARTKEIVVANDVAQEPGFMSNPLLPETKSEVAVPMFVGDRVLGVFDVQHNVVDYFDQAYLDVFSILAGQIATALQNAVYVGQVEESLMATQARFEIGQALAGARTEDEVLDVMVRVAGFYPQAMFSIFTVDPGAEMLTVVTTRVAVFDSGVTPATPVGAHFTADPYPLLRYVSVDKPFISANLLSDERVIPSLRALAGRTGMVSVAVLPIAVGNEWLGVIVAASKQEGYFNERTLYRYESLAEQSASALQSARLRDALSLTQFSVDQGPVAIYWLRPDGSLYSANDTACKLLGYSREEILALSHFTDLDPDFPRKAWARHWEELRERKRLTFEMQHRAKNGRLIPVEVSSNFLQYGGQAYDCAFVRDLTERKRADTERERFTMQLRTAAEISRQVGAILDPDELLQAVIPLLKERFGLYHAHVYVLDEERESLVMRAGYGKPGEIMRQQGHKISLHHERSLVAQAARTKEAVLVNDVSRNPNFMPNLLLPNTKSEVAVPSIIGDRVIGVFDVQSDQVNFFTESDVDVFRTLAGQIANAFQNASLFGQQKRAEAALRESMEQVRAMFEAMTEGIMVTNMMGKIEDVNEAAVRLFGYAGRDELLDRNMIELYAKPDGPRAAEAMQRALETGSAETHEYKMLRPDGSKFHAEMNAALLRDDAGHPRGFVSITRDITPRKLAEQQIATFKALAENAVDAIIMRDLQGHVTYANRASYQLYGYDYERQEMNGLALTRFWLDEDMYILLTQVLPQAGEGGWRGEVRQIRKDTGVFDAAMTVFLVVDQAGQPMSLATITRDITERKQVEAERQRFTVQLRTAADVSAQINAILEPRALLEAVVSLVQKRFGFYHVHVYILDEERENLVMWVGSGEAGRLMRERGHKIPLAREQSLVARAARTREIILVNDVTQDPGFMPNPLLPNTRSEVSVPFSTGDQVLGVFDVQHDALNRFAQADVDVFQTLSAQIATAFQNARYFEEIQQAAARLREVDRLKGEFLANMSHELRTPLNSILGYAEVMLMGLDGELNPEMKEDVEAVFENGQQLLGLINDVLDLTKIEADQMSLTLEPVDVAPLLESSRSNNLGLLHKRKVPVEIILSVEENLPPIRADRVRIAQILNNLVSNAVKFTDAGYISLRAFRDADCVCIEVEDTGIGIANGDQARLFERFRQVDGSSTRRAEGSGLGLAITRHLVQMHGGELKVESELGKGSIFTFCLSIDRPDDGAVQTEADSCQELRGRSEE